MNIGIYLFSTSINQAIPFFLLPILTMYLIPRDFGYINNFSAILIMFNALLGGGLYANIEKSYFSKDTFFMAELMGNLYFVLFCSTIIIFGISLTLVSILEIKLIPEKLFVVIPFLSFFYASFEILKTWLKMKKQAYFFSFFTLSEVVLNVSISLVLVIGLLLQWKGRIIGMAISYLVFGMLSLAYLIHKKYIKISIRIDILKKILRLSLPLLPSGISVMIMRRSGILFIDAFLGKTEAGLYGVGLNLATVILFVSVPFIYVWNPYIYEKLSKNNGIEFMVSLRSKLFMFAVFIFSICILVSFLSAFILRVMTTESFFQAGIFIPWLTFGFAFWAIRLMHLPFFIHNNRQRYIAMIDSVGALLSIILNYFTAKHIGAIGVAVTFFICNFFTFIMVFISVRTFARLPLVPDFKGIYRMARNLIK